MSRNNSFMQYANYLIIFSVCIDQGDGRWKERDKENFRHDVMAYKKMAEKLEQEIEAFYEEYPDDWLNGDNTDRIHNKYLTNLLNRNTETTKRSENKNKEKHIFSFVTVASVDKTTEDKVNKPKVATQHNVSVNESNDLNNSSYWPTFEEILLAMGRKYDRKNDKWIKVKKKSNRLRMINNVIDMRDDKLDFHDRHKFRYKIVKLNRNKSRRNVVVAVSAVR